MSAPSRRNGAPGARPGEQPKEENHRTQISGSQTQRYIERRNESGGVPTACRKSHRRRRSGTRRQEQEEEPSPANPSATGTRLTTVEIPRSGESRGGSEDPQRNAEEERTTPPRPWRGVACTGTIVP
ncbi:hypothetical protein NDU88_005568 [Pleurodeles waltl]|uniref:Uncharacterized protein n=1 Tax=Pleurodeles waltl TaxID=8319 RepID=A0AAV7L165_PLEWA|nr:hypothetical protein NDU88_005568 [Pleurodeles waltl]